MFLQMLNVLLQFDTPLLSKQNSIKHANFESETMSRIEWLKLKI